MKAVLFDLDDTLADHQYSYRSSLAAVQAQYPVLQADDLEQVYNHWLNRLHSEVLAGRYALDEARIERFRQIFRHYGVVLSEAELDAVAQLQRISYQRSQRAIPGVIPLLEHLRGLKLGIGVVTNHLSAEQRDKLRDCALDSYVDVMVTSEDVGLPKPDPAMFRAVLAALDCGVEDVVMIGDSWQSDVLGATALGMRALWLNRYALRCPDPALAREFHSYEPLDPVLHLLDLPQ